MDRQASGAERNPTTQSGEPQAGETQTGDQNTGEQRTGEVVKLEVGGPFDKLGAQGGRMAECRIERVLDLEAPQVMLTVCREIASQKVVLRVVSRHGAATVEIGRVEEGTRHQAPGTSQKKIRVSARDLAAEMARETDKRWKEPSISVDRPARRRPASSR